MTLPKENGTLQTMLRAHALSKTFAGRTVLDEVDLDIAAGTVTALVGPNGSGKSTLLKILWGELGPDSGTIAWNDTQVDTGSESWKRIIGAVPDDDALVEGLSIRGHFRLCGGLAGIARKELEDRTERLISLFDLTDADRSTRSADDASRGNRKRLACALALLGAPSIVLMDEPFSGLDAERAGVLSSILRILASRKRAVVFSCHDDGITRSVADAYLLLHEGKIDGGPIDRLPVHKAGDMDLAGILPWLA